MKLIQRRPVWGKSEIKITLHKLKAFVPIQVIWPVVRDLLSFGWISRVVDWEKYFSLINALYLRFCYLQVCSKIDFVMNIFFGNLLKRKERKVTLDEEFSQVMTEDDKIQWTLQETCEYVSIVKYWPKWPRFYIFSTASHWTWVL